MQEPSRQAVVRALLRAHGRTFADELGIRVESNAPSALYQLLCASILMSARIGTGLAVAAARALLAHGWTTPARMAASTWEQRARVLNRAGYARYDERTASMLGDSTSLLLDRWKGDMRRLREEAERDPVRERRALKSFKGIGDTGADIFLREAQAAWDELVPFADRRVLEGARELGLGTSARDLGRLVPRAEFPRLAAALVRVRLKKDREAVLAAAEDRP